MTQLVSMKEMLDAGAHFGHQTRRWNPQMRPYIYGARNGIYIINLQKTVEIYRRAAAFVAERVSRGEKVLFIGTKKQAQNIIEEEAKRANQYYVNNRWLGGMITNFQTIRKSLERLNDIEKMMNDGTADKLKKKERLGLSRELDKLARNLNGIRSMNRLPGLVFVVDVIKEHNAIKEAQRMSIPIVALVDTNCSPAGIDFPIPSNDDAIRTIKIFTSSMADAALDGERLYKELLAARKDEAKPERVETPREEAAAMPGVEIVRKKTRPIRPSVAARMGRGVVQVEDEPEAEEEAETPAAPEAEETKQEA